MVQSAQRRRSVAKTAYDAYLASCPSRHLLERLADKWVALVIVALADGPLRHAELARRIAGVSQKMLTQTLRALERDGLLTRTVTLEMPLRVDYALTPLGRSLEQEIRGLKRWAEANMPQVERARRSFDTRQERSAGRRAA